MPGIYLHIPFCKQACYYCDFHFSTNQEWRGAMVEAMVQEIQMQHRYLDGKVLTSIYVGGGTPSLLNAQELKQLFTACATYFSIGEGAEVTVEVNPDDLSTDKLNVLKGLGVNRLSIGIQSFSDTTLAFFRRAHSAIDNAPSIRRAREAGFANISVDLIYGVPGQDHLAWRNSLRQLLEHHPEHISAYALTIEPNTVFGRWQTQKKFIPMAEDLVAEQFEILMDVLETEGYEHYEISNFAQPGFAAKHNSSYWRQEWYLGIGPSAHSFNGATRQFNVRNNALYIKSIHAGAIPMELESLTWENKVNEYIMTSLRTSWGCDLQHLEAQLGFRFTSDQTQYLQRLHNEGYLQLTETRISLTRKGKFLADKIAGDLFVVEDSKMANFRL